MIVVLQCALLLLVLAGGTAVVFTRKPEHQAIGLSYFGLVLALLFTAFHEPDVALSQIVIGAVGLPLMFLLALACLRQHVSETQRDSDRKP